MKYALIANNMVMQIDEKPFWVKTPDFQWADISTVRPIPQPGWRAVRIGKAWQFSVPDHEKAIP